jgi:type IV secretory pathway VirB2 component (pilin)
MRHFKKISIFFSLLFLLLVFPAILGQNDARADVCQGSPSCSASQNSTECGNNTGCNWAAGTGCTGTSTLTCSGVTSRTTCISSGCQWIITGSTDDNAFVDTLCRALKIVTGNGGKAFAAFAIISIGIGFFTGKVSWGLMIGVTAGIAAMFGAPTIVAAIAGGDTFDCSAS